MKNNCDTDTYEFDDVLSEHASQKRVCEAVAKPVVEVCPLSFIIGSVTSVNVLSDIFLPLM